MFKNINDVFYGRINGYKKIQKLTDEEYDKFLDLYINWKIWIDGINNPMECGNEEVFQEIANTNKQPLDEFVKLLHKKYGTNSTDHGIIFKYIVNR